MTALENITENSGIHNNELSEDVSYGIKKVIPQYPIPNSQFLIPYTLHLADNSLIMSQRLSEWTSHGPALEQDIALTNIALDYLGQARNYYQYAADLKADGTDEDALAFLRTEAEFSNHLLVELPNGDWGQTILKLFFYSTYQKILLAQLQDCHNENIAGIAAKSLKEITYHLGWSSQWVIRLGDGTEESHARMEKALTALWMFTGELFEKPVFAQDWVNYAALKEGWFETVNSIFKKATLQIPAEAAFQSGGLKGIHTEHIGIILAEMQYLQRVYPNSKW